MVPILIFASIYQVRYQQVLKDELIKNNQHKLSILETHVENEVASLGEIVQQFIVSSDTTPFELETETMRAINMQAKLRQYKNTNNFIKDMVYYFHGHKYIYSSYSSYTFDSFINHMYDYDQWEHQTFKTDIESTSDWYVRANDMVTTYGDDPVQVTTLVYPISKDGISYHATLLFLIPKTSFKLPIDQVYQTNDVTTLLLDDSGQMIYGQGFNDHITLLNFQEHTQPKEDGAQSTIISIYGNSYIRTTSVAPATGWQYISFVSIDSALKVSNDLNRQFAVILILILCIGAVLISLLVSMNYSPIKGLLKMSEGIMTSTDGSKKGNEFDSIKGAINYLSEQNSALTEEIGDNRLAAKEYIVGQLLSGQQMKKEYLDVDVMKQLMNPDLCHYLSFIAHITQEDTLWSELKLEIKRGIEEYSDQDVYFICKESVEKNMIIVIAFFTDVHKNTIKDQITEMHTTLSKRLKINMTLGVGNDLPTLDDLPKSYMGASTAIDYRHMVGSNCVIYYDEIISNMKDLTNYPSAELKLFRQAIKKGNVNEIDSILNKILNYFTGNTMPLFIARGICFEIITVVEENARKLGGEHQELFDKYPDIFSITKYESVFKIIELVKLISYDVCKSLNITYDKDNKILINNMKEYIHDNYMEADFTLQSMADHFNMQKTNLSTFYKDHSGVNIFELATELRMDAAKEMLRNSQLPVNQISAQIGYDNVSSFIRRFKQIYGVTPGNYRLLNNES